MDALLLKDRDSSCVCTRRLSHRLSDTTIETQDSYCWEYANSDCADNYITRVLTENSVSVFLYLYGVEYDSNEEYIRQPRNEVQR